MSSYLLDLEGYHEPTDERGLTSREQYDLDLLDGTGIPDEAKVVIVRHWREAADRLLADSIDLADLFMVGRTAVPRILSQAVEVRPVLGEQFLEPVFLRETEIGFPRTRLWAASDAWLWQRLRPKQRGRWPRRRGEEKEN